MCDNYCSRFSAVMFIFGLVSLALLAGSCERTAEDRIPEAVSEIKECKFPEPPTRSQGDELAITTARLDANRLLVKVRNASERTVYLPYTPEERGTVFISHLTEKRSLRGDFELIPSQDDFSPGLHGLEAGGEIRFTFFEIEKGEYRIILRYLVDGELAELLNQPKCLERFAREHGGEDGEVDTSRTVSAVLEIQKNIPVASR